MASSPRLIITVYNCISSHWCLSTYQDRHGIAKKQCCHTWSNTFGSCTLFFRRCSFDSFASNNKPNEVPSRVWNLAVFNSTWLRMIGSSFHLLFVNLRETYWTVYINLGSLTCLNMKHAYTNSSYMNKLCKWHPSDLFVVLKYFEGDETNM